MAKRKRKKPIAIVKNGFSICMSAKEAAKIAKLVAKLVKKIINTI
jgi:hypothetical protein